MEGTKALICLVILAPLLHCGMCMSDPCGGQSSGLLIIWGHAKVTGSSVEVFHQTMSSFGSEDQVLLSCGKNADKFSILTYLESYRNESGYFNLDLIWSNDRIIRFSQKDNPVTNKDITPLKTYQTNFDYTKNFKGLALSSDQDSLISGHNSTCFLIGELMVESNGFLSGPVFDDGPQCSKENMVKMAAFLPKAPPTYPYPNIEVSSETAIRTNLYDGLFDCSGERYFFETALEKAPWIEISYPQAKTFHQMNFVLSYNHLQKFSNIRIRVGSKLEGSFDPAFSIPEETCVEIDGEPTSAFLTLHCNTPLVGTVVTIQSKDALAQIRIEEMHFDTGVELFVTASSTYQDWDSGLEYPPSAVIDGQTSGPVFYQSLFESYPFLVIDLGRDDEVGQVLVQFPSVTRGPMTLEIRIGIKGRFTLDQRISINQHCNQRLVDPSVAEERFDCQNKLKGKFVSIQSLDCGQIQITEVTIIGTIWWSNWKTVKNITHSNGTVEMKQERKCFEVPGIACLEGASQRTVYYTPVTETANITTQLHHTSAAQIKENTTMGLTTVPPTEPTTKTSSTTTLTTSTTTEQPTTPGQPITGSTPTIVTTSGQETSLEPSTSGSTLSGKTTTGPTTATTKPSTTGPTTTGPITTGPTTTGPTGPTTIEPITTGPTATGPITTGPTTTGPTGPTTIEPITTGPTATGPTTGPTTTGPTTIKTTTTGPATTGPTGITSTSSSSKPSSESSIRSSTTLEESGLTSKIPSLEINSTSTLAPNSTSLEDKVDGSWSQFLEWSPCSFTCGPAQRTRQRFCIQPKPAHGGANCSGVAEEVQVCANEDCPKEGIQGYCVAQQSRNLPHIVVEYYVMRVGTINYVPPWPWNKTVCSVPR